MATQQHRGAAVHAMRRRIAQWPYFELPVWLRALVAVVVAAYAVAICAAAAATPIRLADLEREVVLLVCGAATVELTRRVGEPGPLVRDVDAVWDLPAALLLPPLYVLIVPIPRMILSQLRVRTSKVHRRAYTAAVVGLAYSAASVVFHASWSSGRAPGASLHAVTWVLLATACGLLRKVAKDALILTAVRGAAPQTKLLPAITGGEANFNDMAELSLGTLAAFAAASNILIVVLALPLVVALQRSLRHKQLVSETRVDSKTGLLNAATWQHDAEAELARAARKHTPVAIALIDLDHFKAVNDTYGHLVGDAVLAAVAAGCAAMLREYDIIGRFGGEEFIVLLPDTPLDQAAEVTGRLCAKIPQLAIPASGTSGSALSGITVSIGVAAAAGKARHDLTSLVAAADAALYKAKDTGRNRVWLEADEPLPAHDQPQLMSGSPSMQSARSAKAPGDSKQQPLVLTSGRISMEPGFSPQIDITTPHPARMYDAYLGGSDHYPADRDAARKVLARFPEVRDMALANRAFLRRAVRFLVREAGIRQIIDIGTGIPGAGNAHEVAAEIAPETRVVYIDNDPVVYLRASALATGMDRTAAVLADLREPEAILGHPKVASLVDFGQPVAILLVAVAHFLADEDEPVSIIATLRDRVAPGSYLALSHGTADFHPAGATREAAAVYQRSAAPLVLRTHAQVSAFFEGYDLLEPGLVQAPLWRPSGKEPDIRDIAKIGIYAGVGRK